MASSSSSSPRPLGNLREETATLPHQQPENLSAGEWDVFLSHSGEQKGFARDLFRRLSPFYKVFFDVSRFSLPLGEQFPSRIFHAAKTCKVALVVLSNKFLCSKWPMLELCTFFDVSRVQVLPLFYELSPNDLSDEGKIQEWQKRWEELASKDSRIKVPSWTNACQRLRLIKGLVYEKSNGQTPYLDEIVLAIFRMIPPLCISSSAIVHGKDRLCKVLIDKLEELEQRPQKNLCPDLSRAHVLGVYGISGSGKSTLCACLRERLFSSFDTLALHLKLPSDPTPSQLLEVFKKLLKQTNLGKNKEEMIIMREIEDFQTMVNVLKASNLRSLRVFLVIDNISSKYSMESVGDILRVGFGAGSRVMLVARTLEILQPLLNLCRNIDNDIRYVCGQMRVPSLNKEEAICMLLQHARGQKIDEKYNSSQREIIAEVARICAFRDQSRPHCGKLYLPLILKIVGGQLSRIRMDLEELNRQRLWLETLIAAKGSKEDAVKEIVKQSYQELPNKLKRLFLDVVFFMVPYRGIYIEDEDDLELLGFMHDCSPDTIKRELKELRRLGFLEGSCDWFTVHDLLLEYAKSVRDASSTYYCSGRMGAPFEQVMFDLISRVGLRALILEGDDNCKRFVFPVGLSQVKVVVVRECKSLAVLELAGLTSLVSLEVECCPNLELVQFDQRHKYTLKRARQANRARLGNWEGIPGQPQQGSSQESLLQMVQAGSGMPAQWLGRIASRVWCSMSAWHCTRPLSGFMNLASQLKALEVLRLEETGITSLRDLSSCWPQLRILEVLESDLELLELGNLPNLKQFFYGCSQREVFVSDDELEDSTRMWYGAKMPRNPHLLAGCPGLEDVRICGPSYEDGMGSLRLPPNSRILWLKHVYKGEPAFLEFTSSAHLLEEIVMNYHHVIQSIEVTCQLLNLVCISLESCPNLITITGLERLPMLQRLTVENCCKLHSLGNLEALRTLESVSLVDCPVLTISSQAPSSQHLTMIRVSNCPNVQFVASDLENLSALREVRCNVSGSMFKLNNLVELESVRLEWICEGQANNPLSLCSDDDEADCERVNGSIAQIQGMKYMPLLVVGRSAAPSICDLALGWVLNLVCLDGIHHFSTLRFLWLEGLPNLTCLQGLETLSNLRECLLYDMQNLISLDGISSTLRELRLRSLPKLSCLQGLKSLNELEVLSIQHCKAVKELPSLCRLVKLRRLSITRCANLICLEGLQSMRSLTSAHFDGCENLEHLGWDSNTLEQLWSDKLPVTALSFRGCKFASIQAMLGWVLDEKVSPAVWRASWDALNWELNDNLLGKPRERRELAEHVVESLMKTQLALTSNAEECFDFQPWIDMWREAWTAWGRFPGVAVSARGAEELMGKLGGGPLREVVQQCQTDALFRASAARCMINAHSGVLREWIALLVERHLVRFIRRP